MLLTLVIGISNSSFSQTLKEAIDKKDTMAAMQQLKAGADINAPDGNGSSYLMTACRWADETMVRFLLANGADPNKPRSGKGRTPLMIACAYYSGKGICSMLIQKGADVNIAANDGVTALMLAASNAKSDVVELLLKSGANAKAKDETGKTAVDYATKADVSDYLKQSVKDSRLDKQGVINILERAVK
jgi:uncharacterized protein